jgi:hypothetical protein
MRQVSVIKIAKISLLLLLAVTLLGYISNILSRPFSTYLTRKYMNEELSRFISLRNIPWQWVNENDVTSMEAIVIEKDRKLQYVPKTPRDFLFSNSYRMQIPANAPEPYAYVKRPFSRTPFITRHYYGCGVRHAWANGVVTYFNMLGLSIRLDGRGTFSMQ